MAVNIIEDVSVRRYYFEVSPLAFDKSFICWLFIEKLYINV